MHSKNFFKNWNAFQTSEQNNKQRKGGENKKISREQKELKEEVILS